MKSIINICLKNPLLLNVLTIAIIAIGILSAVRMNREAFPNVDFDTVTITTIYPGASSETVEIYVTDIIEKEVKDIIGVDEVTSSSRENSSTIILKIDPDLSDNEKTKTINEIQKAVDRIDTLPKELKDPPLVTELNSGVMPVMELVLSGDLPYSKLHKISKELADEIESLPDAKAPYKYGFQEKEYWVEVDHKKLDKYHINLDMITEKLRAENLDIPAGVLKTKKGEILVRTIGKLKTTSHIENIVLRTNDTGVQIRIKDVGRAISTFEEESTLLRASGNKCVNLIIRKKSEGDILSLVSDVKKLVEDYKNKYNYSELTVSYTNDISVFVKNRLGVLLNNGLMGILLVLFTLLLFLSKGIAFVAAVGMPVAFLGAIAIMNLLGMSINLLTMFALVIVLGMLVDDAIVVAENIWQHYEQGKSPWQATVDGTREVSLPVTVTILTTIAAFSPLLMVSGIFGKFISAIPQVVIVSLLISLIEALFILPSHAFDIIKLGEKFKGPNKKHKKNNYAFKYIIDSYEKILSKVLHLRYLFVLFIIGCFSFCLWLVKNKMDLVLFPTEGVEVFYVKASLAEGSTLEETSIATTKIEQTIKKLINKEELNEYISYVGLQQNDTMDPFRSQASHVAQVGVFLTPENSRKNTADQIIENLRSPLDQLAKKENITSISFEKRKMGPPVGKPVAIRIKGKNINDLRRCSKILQEELKLIDGVSDIDDNFIQGKNELEISIDKEKISENLLNGAQVAWAIRSSLEGRIATFIQESGDQIPVKVRYNEEQRTNPDFLDTIFLKNHFDNMIPVNRVIKTKYVEGYNNIRHIDGERVITVSASVDESITTSTKVNDFMLTKISNLQKNFPQIKMEAGGEFEDTSDSLSTLKDAMAVALILIFLILISLFRSLTQPLVVMSAIPFGLIGVILAFYVHGLPLSFLAMIGVIGLTGVVVNDSIVLVDFINKAISRGMNTFDAIIYGGRRRFRAVWLTSITTIMGLLPLTYGIGGSDKFLRPAAMALGYGLLFATVLILLLVPAIYHIRADIVKKFNFSVYKPSSNNDQLN